LGTNSESASDLPADWTTRRGPAVGVAGLRGRIRLDVGDSTVGCLKVADETVEILADREAEATLIADSPQTLVGLLGGEKHPVVARLQGRISVAGNVALVIQVFLGLQAGSPWSGLVRKGQS